MAKPQNDDPMLVRTDETMDALVAALSSRFRTPYRKLCRDFKASRAWVDRHVKPNVPRIYISSAPARNKAMKTLGWNKSLSNEKDALCRTWFDAAAYAEWADGSAKVYERTVLVPEALLVGDPSELVRLARAMAECDDDVRRGLIDNAMAEEYKRCDERDGGAKKSPHAVIKAAARGPRSRAEWFERGDVAPSGLGFLDGRAETPASMLDWGDAPEDAHRAIWRHAMLRLVFSVKGDDGSLDERVMYVPSDRSVPNPPAFEHGGVGLFDLLPVPLTAYYDLSGGVRPDWSNPDSVRAALGLPPLCDVLGN